MMHVNTRHPGIAQTWPDPADVGIHAIVAEDEEHD
jgi:hypothetical protein